MLISDILFVFLINEVLSRIDRYHKVMNDDDNLIIVISCRLQKGFKKYFLSTQEI